MYKIYNSKNKAFAPFECIPSEFLPDSTILTKELALDFYSYSFDPKMIDRLKEQSLADENVVFTELSSFYLHSFKEDIFYAPKLALESFKLVNSFEGFNIAIYDGFLKAEASHTLAKLSKAKLIPFNRSFKDNGFRLLEIDPDVAYQAAARVVFDAFDSGADILVVEDVYSMFMFDSCIKQLKRAINRDIEHFCILSFAEFFSLAVNIIPKSLSLHKLKPTLV